jgi:tetratricopeptide (TPR) repeat protein
MCAISNRISRFGLWVILALLPAYAVADAAQYVQWGNQMIAAKKYDDALKYFGGAIQADPKNAAAYKGMGYAYVYKGDKTHALKYLNYAAQLNPSDSALTQYLATLGGGAAPAGSGSDSAYQNGVRYMQAKQYQYAAYYFNQATSSDPNSAKAWQGLGNAFYAQGNKAKAIEAWDKAVSLDPSNSQLANYVASLKGAQAPDALAQAAPSTTAAAASSPAPDDKKGSYNPWIMGGTIVALGAVMLFLF